MKPAVCVKCGLFFKIKKNGTAFEEGMPVNLLTHSFTPGRPDNACAYGGPTCAAPVRGDNGSPPCGRPESAHVAWQPYKLWIGDLWECRGCGAEILIGMPMQPFAEHYQPDYEKTKALRPPALRVNDC